MKQYIMKPRAIEACQWDGTLESIAKISEWVNAHVPLSSDLTLEYEYSHGEVVGNPRILIDGEDERIYPGDYIVHGVLGNFFKLEADQFENAYEEKTSMNLQESRKVVIDTLSAELEIENPENVYDIDGIVRYTFYRDGENFHLKRPDFARYGTFWSVVLGHKKEI